MYSAKFRVKHDYAVNGVGPFIFEGSFNLYFKNILVDSWSAMSGKWGNGALEYGIYLISSPNVLEDNEKNKSFKKEGCPWICHLTPQFKTDRTQLCIHPDGGIYGTLGCIGIEKRDQRLLYVLQQAFKETLKIPLSVEKFIQEV